MIDFEKVCKEKPKDSFVVCLYVNHMREIIHNYFNYELPHSLEHLDLPFPETDDFNYHIGKIFGMILFAAEAGFINESEFCSMIECFNYVTANKELPSELPKLKPW